MDRDNGVAEKCTAWEEQEKMHKGLFCSWEASMAPLARLKPVVTGAGLCSEVAARLI